MQYHWKREDERYTPDGDEELKDEEEWRNTAEYTLSNRAAEPNEALLTT